MVSLSRFRLAWGVYIIKYSESLFFHCKSEQVEKKRKRVEWTEPGLSETVNWIKTKINEEIVKTCSKFELVVSTIVIL